MKRTLFAVVLAAALPLSAQAADFPTELSYSYFEGDYVSADVSGIDSMDGISLRGSASFGKSWYGTASWTRVSEGDIDLGYSVPVDVDFDQMTIGIGWHTAISDKAAFIAEAAYIKDSFEVENNAVQGSADDSFNGYRVTAGLRGQLGERFEGEVKAHWTDFSDVDGGFGGEINGLFNINKTWGITAGWATEELGDSDIDSWHVGIRASY
jgi:opacity protein-like surface antigen